MATRPKSDHIRHQILAVALLSAVAIIVWPSPFTLIATPVVSLAGFRAAALGQAGDAR